jgi:MFS family permease
MNKLKISGMFPAMSHRNFKLFFIGQCVSLIGTWMQNVGQQLLVLNLTNSPSKLGIVTAVQFLPMMLFALAAGTLVDKFPKRTMLLITQTSLAVLAAILAVLAWLKVVQYWHILVLAALLGVVNTLDMPTRQSFFVELVGREDLMNAIAMNSMIFNLARIVGPAIAGLLVQWVGIAACFTINALSFLAVIAGIWMMDVPPQARKASAQSLRQMIGDIGAGLKYVSSRRLLLMPLLLLALTSMFVMNFTTILPFYNQDILHHSEAGYGFLIAAMGVGSFIGATLIAARSKTGPRLRYMIGGAAGMSGLFALMGFVTNYYVACAVILAVGFCTITFTALVNSTIQLNSEDHMRGRVMSVYSLVFGGVTPVGGLYAGELTQACGSPVSMVVSGAIGLAAVGVAGMALRKGSRNQHKEYSEL